MTKTKRATIVQRAFIDNYNDDYTLTIIDEREHSSTFIIVNEGEIIVEFSVSNTSLFDAKSHGNLLSYKGELRMWYTFLKQIDDDLSTEI